MTARGVHERYPAVGGRKSRNRQEPYVAASPSMGDAASDQVCITVLEALVFADAQAECSRVGDRCLGARQRATADDVYGASNGCVQHSKQLALRAMRPSMSEMISVQPKALSTRRYPGGAGE